MSKKSKNRKQAQRGIYALCIAAGAILGLGLGPAFDNVLLSSFGGIALGTLAAYGFTRLASKTKSRTR
ncbi:MAG: hypothetical protein OXD01_04775 [Gammaproteobacteria bacterium]|nr:hypothetical protein [Gammaproteobacteria bacterium]